MYPQQRLRSVDKGVCGVLTVRPLGNAAMVIP